MKEKKKTVWDSLSVLNIHISHSVHALRNMFTKLITGFGWCSEHYVGEEPKSEADCWAKKGLLFRQVRSKAWRSKIHSGTHRKKKLYFKQRAMDYGSAFYSTTVIQINISCCFTCHYKYCTVTWHDCRALPVSMLTSLWQRAEVKRSMHRWYLEGLARVYLLVSKRLSRKLLLASAPSVWKGIKGRRHTFSVPRGQGPSTAQLGLLRASRREGTPLVPRGQTTPRCCPAGHKMSGKGRAQMEECVRVSVFTDVILAYVKCKWKVRKCFNEGEDVGLTGFGPASRGNAAPCCDTRRSHSTSDMK